MRVGLFFGSFDPPHIGHVNVVMGAINSNQVDRVLVIPAYQNLWKENSSKFSYRYAMSCMQFDTLPFVHVSDVEKDLAGPAYPRGIPTYVVLEGIKAAQQAAEAQKEANEQHEKYERLRFEFTLALINNNDLLHERSFKEICQLGVELTNEFMKHESEKGKV